MIHLITYSFLKQFSKPKIFSCYEKNCELPVLLGTLSSFVEDENENEIMTWHALGHWDENIVFGAKIES